MIDNRVYTFKQGDKVMHLKNNYQKEVFNGDIGTINTINPQEEVFSVDYYGRIVEYDFVEMDEISLAYAISVHKSQGSEYPVVILPIMTQHFVLLQRNLLYTAVTRGKKLVITIGTKKALTIALKNNKPKERLSGLGFRLMNIGN
jgi:exodeoxyribonuclease V alpha subunit